MNEFRQEDGTFIMIIRRKKGVPLECFIDAHDHLRLIDYGRRWSAMWNEAGKTFYVYHKIGKQNIYLHRWLMDTPEGMEPDHIDYNGLNNTRINLRNVTKSVNRLNRRMQRNNTSGFRGVIWDTSRQSFVARVKVNRKTKYLGRFTTKEAAHEVVSKYRRDVLGCLS